MTTTRLTAIIAALALVAGLAACGSDGSGAVVASLGGGSGGKDQPTTDKGGGSGGRGDTTDAKFQDAMLAYAKCMRSHGVDMPDPTFDDGGRVSIQGKGPAKGGPGADAFEKADKACHDIIEKAMPEIDLSPQEQAELQDKAVKMARCMRSKGHDMPDPQVGDNGRVTIGSPGGRGLDPSDPHVREDMEACARKVGMQGPRGGRSTKGGTGLVTEGKGA